MATAINRPSKAEIQKKRSNALNFNRDDFSKGHVIMKGTFTKLSAVWKLKQRRTFHLIEEGGDDNGAVLVYGREDKSISEPEISGLAKYVFPVNAKSYVAIHPKKISSIIFCSDRSHYMPFVIEADTVAESEQWEKELKSIITRCSQTTGLHAKYTIGAILGEGAFGKVFKCTEKGTDKEAAVKRMTRKGMKKADILLVHKEVAILKKINHPNIYKHYEFFQDQNHLYMVLELIGGEELFERLTHSHHFGEKKVKEVMKTLCSCLEHLDEVGVLHRDLKPQNIMMTSRKPDADIKLIDFGLGSIDPTSMDIVGSPAFLAPEMAVGALPPMNGRLERAYGSKVDVWSLGVIHYMLMSGTLPFNASNAMEVFKKIVHGGYAYEPVDVWKPVSAEAKTFISCMLNVDVNERSSAKQLLRHAWFSSVSENVHLGAAANNLKIYQAKRQLGGALRTARALLAIKPGKKSKGKTGADLMSEVKEKEAGSSNSSTGKSIAHLKLNVELTDDEKATLKQVFDCYDADCSGTIEESELLEVFLSLGKEVSKEEVHEIMNKLDEDKSGSLELDEFMKYMGGEMRNATETHNCALDMFQSLDSEDTGEIPIEQFKKLLYPILKNTMGAETFEDLMKALDADGSGSIDVDEFEELFNEQ